MRRAIICALLLVVAGVAYGGERLANKYRTHRLTRTELLVTCEDEHEPQVRKLDNSTMIIVSCVEGQ